MRHRASQPFFKNGSHLRFHGAVVFLSHFFELLNLLIGYFRMVNVAMMHLLVAVIMLA